MDYTTFRTPTDGRTIPETAAVASLYEALQKLSDPRRGQGKRYSLALIVCLVVLAKLAGQKTLSGATEWIRHRGSVNSAEILVHTQLDTVGEPVDLGNQS